MLAPETVLQSRYRIIRLLGQGGMGAVYEALDERLDTTVALKETLFAEERLRKQFEREARLLARMHHPALPRVSDHFSEGEGQFLVMQFIAGDDLAEMMKSKQGPFPIDQVLRWGDQLLDALDYLHTQEPQIIHRDIKPQNLKFTSRGQIILLDFGLAKGQTGGVSVVTTSASIFGYTPNYAPLEQIQGLGTDTRSDIYALSATLYHLVTGVKPPDALTRAASLVNGQPDPLRPANEVNSAIGLEVSQVLARAMSQNREQRFATAAEMREALKGTGEVATLTGRAQATTVLFQQPGSIPVEALRPGAKQTPMSTGETTVAQTSEPRGKKRLAPWLIAAASLVLVGAVFVGYFAFQQRNNATAVTPPLDSSSVEPTASPNASQTGTGGSVEPVFGSLTDEKNAETSVQRAEANAKRSEKAARESEKVGNQPADVTQAPTATPPRMAERYPDSQNTTPIVPAAPEINEPDYSRPAPRRRLPGGVTIRNLPDGSQVIINPDGTRVLISPDGTRRILRPGERILRRRG